jgi:hypothetical protein
MIVRNEDVGTHGFNTSLFALVACPGAFTIGPITVVFGSFFGVRLTFATFWPALAANIFNQIICYSVILRIAL